MDKNLKNPQTKVEWVENPATIVTDVNHGLKRIIVWHLNDREIAPESKVCAKLELVSETANLELLILIIGQGKGALDLQLDVRHLVPRTFARVELKAVLGNESKIFFKGNIFVSGEGRKTDTFMRCDSLLLSGKAKAKTIPALEIIASDVKAGHAASTGQIDENQLFYLKSRGFTEAEAKQQLVEAFLRQSLSVFRDIDEEEKAILLEKLTGLAGDIVI